jgi:hypothetical protein
MIRIRLCHTILDIPCNCEEDILNIEVCFGTLHATPCLHIKDCPLILKKQDWEKHTKHAETASCFYIGISRAFAEKSSMYFLT